MVIKKDDYGMIKLGSVNSEESVKTLSGYLKQFFKSLKKMSKEDQLLLSKYYVQVFGKSREQSDDVYKLLNENSFLNRMLKNTSFKESSLVYFSFETGNFSVYDDLEQITPIHKSICCLNLMIRSKRQMMRMKLFIKPGNVSSRYLWMTLQTSIIFY